MKDWIVMYLSRRCVKVSAVTVDEALRKARESTGQSGSNVISVIRL